MSYLHRTTFLCLARLKTGCISPFPWKLGRLQFSKIVPEVTAIKQAQVPRSTRASPKPISSEAKLAKNVSDVRQNTLQFKTNDSVQLFYKPRQQIVTFAAAVPSSVATIISAPSEQTDHNGRDDVQILVKDVVFLINRTANGDGPFGLPTSSPATTTNADSSTLAVDTAVAPNVVPRLVGVNVVHPKDLEWHEQTIQLKKLPKYYLTLSKVRLTALVVLTEIAGYAMAPAAFDPTIFAVAAIGTAFLSSSANTVNQFFEVPFDSQMTRTRNRVLVKGLISPLHAATFAVVCSSLGLSLLYFGVNGLTASLGALNLFLYTLVYTPMKRVSIANTWLGSVVGAIPPMMGWTACTGTLDAGALLMGGLLFAWQFPHFNALSWNLRGDYSRAGYRMMSVTNPDLCKLTSLRYSVAILLMCGAAPLIDLTTWMFAADSLPLNSYLVYLSWRFYRDGDSASSRKLFRFSLVHLPALMILLLISKKHYGPKQPSSAKAELGGSTGIVASG